MKVLIVDCYASNKRGRQGFNAFLRTLDIAIKNTGPFKNDIMTIHRDLRNVGDFVVDWNTEELNEDAKARAKKFDTLDIICVCGDMEVCPWDPRYMKVVVLLAMADLVKKPVLGLGAGAYAAVYALATCGRHFHMLNEPYGQPYSKLASWPVYSKATKLYESGWLNNETGDVYSFSSERKLWKPVCNIGMFRIATTGKPTPTAPGMRLPINMVKDDHSLTEDQNPEALYFDDRETSCHIRNPHIQNRFLKGLSSQNFIACELQNWHMNADGALPTTKGVYVLAENARGPIILGKGRHNLYLACEINQGRSYDTMRHIISNFLREITMEIRADSASGTRTPRNSIQYYLFGDAAGRGSLFRAGVTVREEMAPTLAAAAVASRLPGGPTQVDIPVFAMFFSDADDSAAVDAKTAASRQKKGSSTLGRRPKSTMRHPLMSRRSRLDKLFKETGNDDMKELGHRAMDDEAVGDPLLLGGTDAKAILAATVDMRGGKVANVNSESKVAGNLREQRRLYREKIEMEARNRMNEDKRYRRASPLEEYTDSISLTPRDDYSIGGELVKVGDRVMRVERRRDESDQASAHSNFGRYASETVSITAIKSEDPPSILVPAVAEPLSRGPSDWKKLKSKMQDDEDHETRLQNDKTRVVDWARSLGKPVPKRTADIGVPSPRDPFEEKPGPLHVMEQQYQNERKQMNYLPPDHPDRIVRDSEELRMFKQLQQGVLTSRPGSAPAPHKGGASGQSKSRGGGVVRRPDTTEATIRAGYGAAAGGGGGGGGGASQARVPFAPATQRQRPRSQGAGWTARSPRPLSGSSLTAKGIPRPQTTVGAVRVSSGVRKPYNNAKKFDDMTATERLRGDKGEYLGQYTTPYMTPYEQEKDYVRKNKGKWSGGHFRLAFGKGSALPLRKDCGVGGSGPFPDPPRDPDTKHLRSQDWILVRRLDREKHVAGPWKTATK